MGFSLQKMASMVENDITKVRGVANQRLHINQIKDFLAMGFSNAYDTYEKANLFSPEELAQFQITLSCIQLQCKPLFECCNGEISDELVLAGDIPSYKKIIYLGVLGYKEKFQISYTKNFSYIESNKFLKGKTIAWMPQPKRVFILNPPTQELSYLQFTFVPSNIRDIYKYDCSKCRTDEDDLPLSEKFAYKLVKDAVAYYVGTNSQKQTQPNTQTDQV